MAVGDLTAVTTEYSSMALLNAALDALNSGAATAGADTISFFITPGGNGSIFYLTKITRAGA